MAWSRRWGGQGPGAVLATLLVAVVALGAAPAAAAAPAAWTRAGHDPGNTGYNPDEPTVNAGTIAKLKRRWTATPGPGTEGCGPSPQAPLVAGGRVFVLDGRGVGAYDAASGKRLWLYTAGHLEATG